MKKLFFLFLLCCVAYLSFPAFAPKARAIREGNDFYKYGEYDKAIEKYRAAGAESPDSDIVNFNLGDAFYKKGRYPEAVDAFTKALNTLDREIKGKALYNLANGKYKLGISRENKDPEGAVILYRQSLDLYRKSMDLNKNDGDSAFNYELVENRLRELLEKKQSPQGQDNRGPGKKNSPDKGEPQSQGRGKQAEIRQKNGGSAQTANNRKQALRGTASDTQASGSVGQEQDDMSPDEAKMLLDSYGREEAGQLPGPEDRSHYEGEAFKDW